MYALNLAVDGRILSATFEQYAYKNSIIVDLLPSGNISDYKYVNEQYVYDPLPEPFQPEPESTVEERITDLEFQMAALTDGYVEGVNQA